MVSSEGWGTAARGGALRQRHAPRDFPLQTTRDQDFHNFVSAGIKTPERLVAVSMRNNYPGLDWTKIVPYNLERMAVHGGRRAAEMEEVADTLRELGV